jgi:[ribosomal protein S5]-alanine N-acetyltransferase
MKTVDTPRLFLRSWQLEDADDLYEYAKKPNVGPMAGWEPHAGRDMSLEVLKAYIEEDVRWAIVLRESGRLVRL